MLEGMAPGANISDVCRNHGILQPQYFKCYQVFPQGGLPALASTKNCSREKELEEELEEEMKLLGR